MTDTEGQHRAPDQGLWKRIELSEPVRLRLWTVTAAIVAILVSYGVLEQSAVQLWLALAAALLGVSTTSMVRAAVVSPATAKRTALDAAKAVEDEAMHPLTAAGLAVEWNGIRD